jgi:5-methylcytosine-specific restriction endonuclease McrA
VPRRPGRDDPRYRAARLELKKWDHTCHLCKHPIDMQLRWPHPLSWSADHKVPTSGLPRDDPRQWHITNLAAAHLRCNEARGNKTIRRPPPLNW